MGPPQVDKKWRATTLAELLEGRISSRTALKVRGSSSHFHDLSCLLVTARFVQRRRCKLAQDFIFVVDNEASATDENTVLAFGFRANFCAVLAHCGGTLFECEALIVRRRDCDLEIASIKIAALADCCALTGVGDDLKAAQSLVGIWEIEVARRENVGDPNSTIPIYSDKFMRGADHDRCVASLIGNDLLCTFGLHMPRRACSLETSA